MAQAADRATVGKVEWQVTMSLDGFIAGPGDDMDWVFEYADPGEDAGDLMATTGAMLSGRRSYDVGRRDTGKQSGEAYGGGWSGSEFVLTHNPPDDDPSVTFLSGDIREAVATALAAAGGKNVAVTGADVARQCIEAGLVDELVVFLAPVLLGDGTRLFGGPGMERVNLERVDMDQSGQTTALRFRVLK